MDFLTSLREAFRPLTPQVFDALVIAAIVIGLALAAVRLYRDFTRPLPLSDDTQPILVPRSPAVSSDPEALKQALEEDSTI